MVLSDLSEELRRHGLDLLFGDCLDGMRRIEISFLSGKACGGIGVVACLA
jgi:hypothetical protein